MWPLNQPELRVDEQITLFRREFNAREDEAVKTLVAWQHSSKRGNPFVQYAKPSNIKSPHQQQQQQQNNESGNKKNKKKVEVIYLDEDVDGRPIIHHIPTEQEQMYIKAFDCIKNERLQTLFLAPIYDYSGCHQCSIYYVDALLRKYNLHFIASFYSLSNAENLESQHRFCMLTRLLSYGSWTFADQLAVLDLIQVLTTCPRVIAYKLGWKLHYNVRFLRITEHFINWLKEIHMGPDDPNRDNHGHPIPPLLPERVFDVTHNIVVHKPSLLFILFTACKKAIIARTNLSAEYLSMYVNDKEMDNTYPEQAQLCSLLYCLGQTHDTHWIFLLTIFCNTPLMYLLFSYRLYQFGDEKAIKHIKEQISSYRVQGKLVIEDIDMKQELEELVLNTVNDIAQMLDRLSITKKTQTLLSTSQPYFKMEDEDIIARSKQSCLDVLDILNIFKDPIVINHLPLEWLKSTENKTDGLASLNASLNPHRCVLYTNLASISLIEQNYRQCQKYCQEAIQCDNTYAPAYRYQRIACIAMGPEHTAAAQQCLLKLKELDTVGNFVKGEEKEHQTNAKKDIQHKRVYGVYGIGGPGENNPPPRILHSATRLNEDCLLIYGGITYSGYGGFKSQDSKPNQSTDDVQSTKKKDTDTSKGSNPSQVLAESVKELWTDLAQRVKNGDESEKESEEEKKDQSRSKKKEEMIIYNDMWILDLKKQTWTPKIASKNSNIMGRYDHSGILMKDGQSIMMIGGKHYDYENDKNRYDALIDNNHWDLRHTSDYLKKYQNPKDFLGDNVEANAMEAITTIDLLRDEGSGDCNIVHVYDVEQDMWYTPTHTGQIPPYYFLMNHSSVVFDVPEETEEHKSNLKKTKSKDKAVVEKEWQQRVFLFPEHTRLMYVMTPQPIYNWGEGIHNIIMARYYELNWQRVELTLPIGRVLCKPLIGFINAQQELVVCASTDTLHQVVLTIDPITLQTLRTVVMPNTVFDHYKISPGRILSAYKYFHFNFKLSHDNTQNYDVVMYHGGMWLDRLESLLIHEGVLDVNGNTLQQLLININTRNLMLVSQSETQSNESQEQTSEQSQIFWLGNEVKFPDLGLPPLFGHALMKLGDRLVITGGLSLQGFSTQTYVIPHIEELVQRSVDLHLQQQSNTTNANQVSTEEKINTNLNDNNSNNKSKSRNAAREEHRKQQEEIERQKQKQLQKKQKQKQKPKAKSIHFKGGKCVNSYKGGNRSGAKQQKAQKNPPSQQSSSAQSKAKQPSKPKSNANNNDKKTNTTNTQNQSNKDSTTDPNSYLNLKPEYNETEMLEKYKPVQLKAQMETEMKMKMEKDWLLEIQQCFNCGVIEIYGSEYLIRCNHCLQASYCTEKCLKEHWQKIHASQCTKTITPNTTTTNAIPTSIPTQSTTHETVGTLNSSLTEHQPLQRQDNNLRQG